MASLGEAQAVENLLCEGGAPKGAEGENLP